MTDHPIEATLSKEEFAPVFSIAAGVIVMRGGRLLLQRRIADGTWAIFGGFVGPGEAIDDAARRELYERSGLLAGKLSLYGVFSGPELRMEAEGGDVPVVAVVYLCDEVEGDMAPEEGVADELKWFPVDEIPHELFLIESFVLRDLVRKLTATRRLGRREARHA